MASTAENSREEPLPQTLQMSKNEFTRRSQMSDQQTVTNTSCNWLNSRASVGVGLLIMTNTRFDPDGLKGIDNWIFCFSHSKHNDLNN